MCIRDSVSSVAVYGGNDGVLFEQQKKGLMLGADVVIATPGRLIAHLSLGYVDLSRVSYSVSYTHLDVYKRQVQEGLFCCIHFLFCLCFFITLAMHSHRMCI